MLVLSRKRDESIIIGKDVEVIVLGIEGDQVRLGINAPKDISIYRKELFLEIEEENKKAADFKGISLKNLLKNKEEDIE